MRVEQLAGPAAAPVSRRRPRRSARAARAQSPRAVDSRSPAPNRVWAADITAHPDARGLALSRRPARSVVAPGRRLGPAAHARDRPGLRGAACRRGAPRAGAAAFHHSDRGAQYTSDRYQALLRAHGFRCSMSRPGNCYDNAPVESFFRTLKTELGSQTHATRGGRDHGDRRLHRTLLQPRTAALDAALSEPRRLRGDLEGSGMMQSNPSTETDQHQSTRSRTKLLARTRVPLTGQRIRSESSGPTETHAAIQA